jgi:hypothetical protein
MEFDASSRKLNLLDKTEISEVNRKKKTNNFSSKLGWSCVLKLGMCGDFFETMDPTIVYEKKANSHK